MQPVHKGKREQLVLVVLGACQEIQEPLVALGSVVEQEPLEQVVCLVLQGQVDFLVQQEAVGPQVDLEVQVMLVHLVLAVLLESREHPVKWDLLVRREEQVRLVPLVQLEHLAIPELLELLDLRDSQVQQVHLVALG